LGFSRRKPPVRGKQRPLKLEPLENRCLLSALTIIQRDNFGGSAGTVGNAIPGEAISYSIVVSNTGSTAATGVTVSDTVPAILTGLTLTPNGSTATLGSGAGAGKVVLNPFSLAPGGSATYVLSGMIPSSATGQLSNTATVTASNAKPASVTATDVDKLTPRGDLSIAISDNFGGSSGTSAAGSAAGSATGAAIPGEAFA
jgi:uncharacterized repeat protein (TIGR01451 family)